VYTQGVNAAARRTRKARAGRPLVALAYCRVSTSEQARNGASMAAQLADLQARAEREGWTFVPFTDPGVSGRSLDRPGMRKVLAMLAAGEADVLLAASIDRISRNTHDYTGLIDLAAQQKWQLVTLREGYDTSTAAGRMQASIGVVIAQHTREDTVERIKRGMRQRRAEGVHTGRHSTMKPELFERVQQLKALGYGERRTATTLTREGWQTPGGSSVWSAGAARSALAVQAVGASTLPADRPEALAGAPGAKRQTTVTCTCTIEAKGTPHEYRVARDDCPVHRDRIQRG
jgi:DNA invertase Pin-like site-specific DNA recombinase